mmetsp:Transcript_73643/g.177744  ORF Transcript_73643/g.177744 Transcript_73643/m.177744 type:complete len:293 (+) Transcript_73643:52-930(+)
MTSLTILTPRPYLKRGEGGCVFRRHVAAGGEGGEVLSGGEPLRDLAPRPQALYDRVTEEDDAVPLENGLVSPGGDADLGGGHRVDEVARDLPDAREDHRRVDHVGAVHRLRVVEAEARGVLLEPGHEGVALDVRAAEAAQVDDVDHLVEPPPLRHRDLGQVVPQHLLVVDLAAEEGHVAHLLEELLQQRRARPWRLEHHGMAEAVDPDGAARQDLREERRRLRRNPGLVGQGGVDPHPLAPLQHGGEARVHVVAPVDERRVPTHVADQGVAGRALERSRPVGHPSLDLPQQL